MPIIVAKIALFLKLRDENMLVVVQYTNLPRHSCGFKPTSH